MYCTVCISTGASVDIGLSDELVIVVGSVVVVVTVAGVLGSYSASIAVVVVVVMGNLTQIV